MKSIKYSIVFKALIAFLLPVSVALGAATPDLPRCASAAGDFLQSLSEEQRRLAQWPFDDDKRRKWTYFPNVPELDVRTEGLALRDMNAQQRVAAHILLECGLSSQGYQKAAGIIRLDDILAQTDLYRPKTPEQEAPVGAEKYWLAVFGNPESNTGWGWQFEGHHLAVNFTVVDGQIIYAPAFMGVDPARVPDGRYAGWRILGAEVDYAIALAASLSEQQLPVAVLAPELPERLFTSPGREDSLQEFSGISAGALNRQQQAILQKLIRTYVDNSEDSIAEAHQREIAKHWPENTWFAWMGPVDAEQGIYYRIHSPGLLIEFVTARDRQSKNREPNPNHLHTMFAYPGNNYGDDLLRRHYETSPDHEHE